MPVYLDVGAQRVQDWIMATPQLDLMRGASHALAQVTAPDVIQKEWLDHAGLPGCSLDREAGDKDGVVVLVCPDAATAQAAARSLVRHLRTKLPRVSWSGWWTEADSYLAAYLKAEKERAGVHRISAFPDLFDVPVLEQCPDCRQEPKNRDAQGRDCAARKAHAEPPKHLLELVPRTWPTTFDHLAKVGGLGPSSAGKPEALGRRDSRNHLALIKADGNKVGQVFAEIADHAGSLPTLSRRAVGELNQITRQAVEAAAVDPRVTDPDAGVKGALPHYVGGDDVLVSVPAARAWRFAATLGRHFESLQDTWLQHLDADLPPGRDDALRAQLRDLIEQVSLGIGMVFARASFPIATTNQIATTALSAAKQFADGEFGAIAWVDLSAEGLAGARRDGSWLQVLSVRDVREQLEGASSASWAAAYELFAVPPAGRARLAQEIREARNDQEAIINATLWCDATGRPGALRALAESGPHAILPLISRARWWPLASLEESKS